MAFSLPKPTHRRKSARVIPSSSKIASQLMYSLLSDHQVQFEVVTGSESCSGLDALICDHLSVGLRPNTAPRPSDSGSGVKW